VQDEGAWRLPAAYRLARARARGFFNTLLGSSPVLAASPTASDRTAAAGPLCTGYVTANPTYESDPVNTTATVNVNWYCEGTFHVVANIKWGDGNSDNYTCWSNCSSGSTQFNHVYVTRGYF
jgi:hypothetical protein